jgi:zinc/manganese transport system substrate-binding protein
MVLTRRTSILTSLLLLGRLGQTHSAPADPVAVTASFSVLGDLVRVVGGEQLHLQLLVGANRDAHTFEPHAGDAKALLGSRLLVSNGLGFEPWIGRLVRSSGFKGRHLLAATGIKSRNMADERGKQTTDPHAWQNPLNVTRYVRNIADALSDIDPGARADYQARAQAYSAELMALDNWAKGQFATISPGQRKAIISHDAFGYLGEHYGVQFSAPVGISTEAQPNARQMAQLIRQIKRENIRALFIENMSNPQLIRQLAQEIGLQPGPPLFTDALSEPDGPAPDYLSMMRHNIGALASAMRHNGGATS